MIFKRAYKKGAVRMSIKKVEKFFELEKSDKNLVQKMKSISNEIQSKGETVGYEDVIKTKIIPIAKEYGFD